jgi:hypothetical protein
MGKLGRIPKRMSENLLLTRLSSDDPPRIPLKNGDFEWLGSSLFNRSFSEEGYGGSDTLGYFSDLL